MLRSGQPVKQGKSKTGARQAIRSTAAARCEQSSGRTFARMRVQSSTSFSVHFSTTVVVTMGLASLARYGP